MGLREGQAQFRVSGQNNRKRPPANQDAKADVQSSPISSLLRIHFTSLNSIHFTEFTSFMSLFRKTND